MLYELIKALPMIVLAWSSLVFHTKTLQQDYPELGVLDHLFLNHEASHEAKSNDTSRNGRTLSSDRYTEPKTNSGNGHISLSKSSLHSLVDGSGR